MNRRPFCFSLFLCLAALVLSAVLVTVPAKAAASGTCGTSVTWTLDDSGTLTISGTGAMADYAAASDAPWYNQRTAVTKIVVADNVTTIGDRAFYNCAKLTDVSIGKDVRSIGTYAFRNCSGLQTVTVSANVTELKDSAFRACTMLTEITFGGNAPVIGSYVFDNSDASLTVQYYEGSNGFNTAPWTDYTQKALHVGQWVIDVEATCTTAGTRHIDCSFCGTTVTESYYVVHQYVEEICSLCRKIQGLEYYLYSGSVEISDYTGSRANLEIPATIEGKPVTRIGSSAFRDCASLISITLPDSLESIGNYVFYGCTGLTTITIPDSLASIGWSAFSGCIGLKDVYISDSSAWCKISFGDSYANPADYNTSLHFLDADGNEVTDIILDDSVTVIPSWAFEYCTDLTSITIPDSVESIGDGAFSGCTGLTSITIPDSVESIGDGVFSGCTGLTSITLPDGLESIGDRTFRDCTGLTSITIPDCAKSIGYRAFSGCTGLTSITLPDSVERIGSYVFYDCTGLTSITLPDSMESIGEYAFYSCTGLTSITIPNGVKSIGYEAFSGCAGLTSITLPGSLESIGKSAFYNCTGLTSITIPDSVESIGESAFSLCSGLTSITLPDSMESIGAWAFYDCTGLTSITIPDSVESIGVTAFYGCNNLQDVYYGGDSFAWGSLAVDNIPADCRIHYSCADPTNHWAETKRKDATCTEDGYINEVCLCNYSRTTTILGGHKDEEPTDYKCDICGKDLPKPEDPKPELPKVEGVTRLAGKDRLVTSQLIADQLKVQMGIEKFDNIIIASGATFADALPGSYLAAEKNAPILLTLSKQKYIDQTAAYVKANLAEGGTVYILGGESAVPKLMEAALTGLNVKRVAGADRFGTNLAILQEAGVKAGEEILVCTAREFADSLSAAATGKPILLVYKKLTDAQKEYLATLSGNTFCVVGGTTAVPETLAQAVGAYGAVTRLAGKDRLDTSIQVARKYFSDAKTAVIAYGWDFPDGLCGGSLAYATKSPLILAHSKEKLHKFTADYTTRAGLKDGYILGGDKLVDDTSAKAIFGLGNGNIHILS